jgi:hypothetical protein
LLARTAVTVPHPKETSATATASNVRYARILRCIGQSLEMLDLRSLELRRHGELYIVQGWNRGAPVSKEVDKQYTINDIKKLEAEGRARRSSTPQLPNLLSLSQVLRLAGSYVDRMRGRLVRISWQDQSDRIQSVTIQYEPFPVTRAELPDSQIVTIEEICVHLYKQKKKIISASEKSGPRPLVNLGNGHPAER